MTNKNLTLFAFLAGATMLCSGCATLPIKNQNLALSYWQNAKSAQTQEIGKKNSEKLRENEYVLPDAVIDTFARIADKTPTVFWAGGPAAGHLEADYLKENKNKEEFCNKLKTSNYNDTQISTFYTILSTPGNTIIKQSVLDDAFFDSAVSHERFHQELENLSDEEKNVLHEAYAKLKNRKAPEGHNTFMDDKPKYAGFATMAVNMNEAEFYPYLADNKLEDYVEEAVKTDFPKAYSIYEKIKDKTKLTKTQNKNDN